MEASGDDNIDESNDKYSINININIKDIKIIVEEEVPRVKKTPERNGVGGEPATMTPTGDTTSLLEVDDKADEAEKMAKEKHKSVWVMWNDANIAEYISRTARSGQILLQIQPCHRSVQEIHVGVHH